MLTRILHREIILRHSAYESVVILCIFNQTDRFFATDCYRVDRAGE